MCFRVYMINKLFSSLDGHEILVKIFFWIICEVIRFCFETLLCQFLFMRDFFDRVQNLLAVWLFLLYNKHGQFSDVAFGKIKKVYLVFTPKEKGFQFALLK